jgi:hypothetical protein
MFGHKHEKKSSAMNSSSMLSARSKITTGITTNITTNGG